MGSAHCRATYSSYYDHHQDNSTSDWSPRQAPGTEVLDVRSPASKIPCRRHTSPPASHADPCRSWNPCNLRDAQLKHLVEKCPPGHQVYSDVFNLLHVLHCNRSALHCAALF